LDDIDDLKIVKTCKPVKAIRYNMFGFFRQCVEVYCDLTKLKPESLRQVATPGMDDHLLKLEDFEEPGHLSLDAAKIIMKALYGARLVRFELLWPICSSAREVSKWTRACDKRLHRLMCYIHHTPDHSLESFVGDDAQHCHVVLYSDADFAGDMIQAKSTSGLYMAIVGPNTFAPITASCKKQTCVSHSSTESEIVAAEQGIRTEGLQALAFWELVTELLSTAPAKKAETRTVIPKACELNPYSELFDPAKYFAYTRRPEQKTCLLIAEDNEAVIKLVKKARSMALRHLPRTHRIDLHWLFEVCSHPRVRMRYVNTKQQAADMMTKSINNPATWNHLLELCQIRPGLESVTGVLPALLAAPPGLALPILSKECPVCNFNVSETGSQCPCRWS